jgi:glucokinase
MAAGGAGAEGARAGAARGSVLAIDAGGTKLAAALIDPGGRMGPVLRAGTPRDLDADGLWRTLSRLVDRLLGTDEPAAVGIGCGGPMRWPQGRVSPLNIPAWRDFPLRDRVAERFPGRLVRIHNDAVCVAVGEHWRGAGRGRRNVLGMVVSTGVGGGLILDGRLINGTSGNAGHIGHVVVDPDGPECVCGGRGCLEAVARAPALVAWARERGWNPREAADGRALAEDAARGDAPAMAAMERGGSALGVAIASATHLLDLEVVSIGGGLAQAGPLLFDPLERAFHRHARMDFARHVRVVPAALGQEAGLFGAAALVLDDTGRYWPSEAADGSSPSG